MRLRLTLVAFALFLAPALSAQIPPGGPMKPPPPGREVRRLPSNPTPTPPPIPVPELISRIVANEDKLRDLYLRSNFRRAIRIVEYAEDGTPSGEFILQTQFTSSGGSRRSRTTEPPVQKLQRTEFAPDEIDFIVRVPPFVLTSDQIDRYNITYQGPQPLDELQAFLFRVQPKMLDRRRPAFEGLVWVDDRDYTIVKMYGQMVLETGKVAPEIPFSLYELFRENVSGPVWMPSFVRADDTQRIGDISLAIRLTVRFSDFELPSSSPAPPPPATPPSAPPPAKPPATP